ncbi:MAG: CpXC domain-containing protein [Flavobacteriales bacterium]
MSNDRALTVACPQCEKQQTIIVWDAVNVLEEPDMKEEVLEQRVNMFVCTGCGKPITVDMPFLYHDPEQRFVVQYVTAEEAGSPEYYEYLYKDGTVVMEEEAMEAAERSGGQYLLLPHQVFSMRELAAYVVFRDMCEEYGRE